MVKKWADGEVVSTTKIHNEKKVSLKDIVTYLLRKYPQISEDNLILKTWKIQDKDNISSKEYSFHDFAVALMKGEYYSPREILKIKDELE